MEYFDTLKDLEFKIRSFAKEAGFSIVLVQPSGIDKHNKRIVKCTKGVTLKNKKLAKELEDRKEEIQDEDL